MDKNFKLEIVSPEKIIFSDSINMVTIPSYEGDMSILKNHISLITFLRPGIISVEKNNQTMLQFFVQDGTVEFFNDNFTILSPSAINVKDLTKEYLGDLNKITQNSLEAKNITDENNYILNRTLDVIKEISI